MGLGLVFLCLMLTVIDCIKMCQVAQQVSVIIKQVLM